MTKKEYYQHELAITEDCTGYLLKHSNLPGPRANLELMEGNRHIRLTPIG